MFSCIPKTLKWALNKLSDKLLFSVYFLGLETLGVTESGCHVNLVIGPGFNPTIADLF